jgi:hypothetical protein
MAKLPPAISGDAGLEHSSGSVTRPIKSVTVRTGGMAVSMENSRLREAAPKNVTVGKRGREYLTDREVERLIEAAKQNRTGHRDANGYLGRLPPWSQGLGAGGTALGRHRTGH